MKNGRYIAYYRVSTKRQGRSGLGLDAQKNAVADFLNGGRWTLIDEFTEVESGKRADRPELAKALALCRVMNAQLIIAKLDRLARNVAFISALMESNVDFVACDLPQADRFTVHILAAVAEKEAQAISARTKAALAVAKARGIKLGGYKGNSATIYRKGIKASAKARSQKAQAWAADMVPVIETIREEAIQKDGTATLRDIAARLNEKGILTARDGERYKRGIPTKGQRWSAVQVQRVMNRA